MIKKIIALFCLAAATAGLCACSPAEKPVPSPPAYALAKGDGWWVEADYQYINAKFDFTVQLLKDWQLPSNTENIRMQNQMRDGLNEELKEQYSVVLTTLKDSGGTTPEASMSFSIENKGLSPMITDKSWIEINRQGIIEQLMEPGGYKYEESDIEQKKIAGKKAYYWEIRPENFDPGTGEVKENYWIAFVRFAFDDYYFSVEMNAESAEAMEECWAILDSIKLK